MSLGIRNTNVQVSDLQSGNLSNLINLNGIKVVSNIITVPINAPAGSYGTGGLNSSSWLLPYGDTIMSGTIRGKYAISAGAGIPGITIYISQGTSTGGSLTAQSGSVDISSLTISSSIRIPDATSGSLTEPITASTNCYIFLTIANQPLTSVENLIMTTLLVLVPTPFN